MRAARRLDTAHQRTAHLAAAPGGQNSCLQISGAKSLDEMHTALIGRQNRLSACKFNVGGSCWTGRVADGMITGMRDDESEKPTTSVKADKIPPRAGRSLPMASRRLSFVVGALAAGAGSVAVFDDHSNVGGVPVLLVVGGAFLYVGITGQRLLRLKWGDKEFDLEGAAPDIADIAEEVLTGGPADAEVEQKAAAILQEVAPVLPPARRASAELALASHSDAVRYEVQVHEAIERVAIHQLEAAMVPPKKHPGVDAVLGIEGGGQVAVEIRYRRAAVEVDVIRQMWAYVATWPKDGELRGAVLVAPTPLTAVAGEELVRLNAAGIYRVRAVVWRTPADDGQLSEALRDVGRP